MLRNYFAPGAVDAVYQDAVRFPRFKWAALFMGELSAKFDLLRRKAESRMRPGSTLPGVFAPVPCSQNAFLYRADKSPALASVRGNLGVAEIA